MSSASPFWSPRPPLANIIDQNVEWLRSRQCCSFIDRAHCHVRRHVTANEIRRLKEDSRLTHVKPNGGWTVLQVCRPGTNALNTLRRMSRSSFMKFTMLEFAHDILVSDPGERDELRAFFEYATVLPELGSRHRPHRHRTVSYLAERRSSWNTALYSDLPSKVTGKPCVHVELRLRGEDAILQQGFCTPDDLIALDISAFLRQRLRFMRLPDDLVALGVEYLRDHPTYAHTSKRCPYGPARIGKLLVRMSATPKNIGIVHSVFHTLSEFEWFDVTRAIQEYPVDQVIRTPENARESRSKRPPGGRPQMRKTRPRDLSPSEETLEKVDPLYPPPQKRHPRGGGRKRTSNRACFITLLAWARGWCRHHEMKTLGLVPSGTVSRRWTEWRDAGFFEKLIAEGIDKIDELKDIDWSLLVRRSCKRDE